MSTTRRLVITGIAVAAALAWPSPGLADDPVVAPVDAATACVGDSTSPGATPPTATGLTAFARPDVKAIAEQITCYCGCPHLQVSKCFCGTADAIREKVASQLDQGMTPDAIIAAYVVEHGTWILAEPPKRGFNWIIWVVPVLLIVFGGTALLVAGRRWAAVTPLAAPAALDAASRDRLRRELDAELERER